MTDELAERIRQSDPSQWPTLNRELAIALGWTKNEPYWGHESWRTPEGVIAMLPPNFLISVDACITECERRGWKGSVTFGEGIMLCVVHDGNRAFVAKPSANAALAFSEALAMAVHTKGLNDG